MDLKIDREWLLRMAEGEGDGNFSVGGIVVTVEKEYQANIAALEAELSTFRSLMTNVVPGDGSGVEVPATPESLLAYIGELQNEWDAAEKRNAILKAENTIMRQCLTDIRDNYDCDGHPGKHDTQCRCCKADAALHKDTPMTLEGDGK